MTLPAVRSELRRHASAAQAKILQGFFKTGPGQYGEGDIFIGVKVPATRKVAAIFQDLSVSATLSLLKSPIHEERLLALLILIRKYEQGDASGQQRIVDLYLAHTRYINNWDLVDLSAAKIIGHFLIDKERGLLDRLARSKNLWERRISIIATYAFIREQDLGDTFRIADRLLADPEDLMHKAVGWMLREAGKRDVRALEDFLKPRYLRLPRTLLRYAIERFPEAHRKRYLKGLV